MRIFLFSLCLLLGCTSSPKQEYVQFQGKTMGTYYRITFEANGPKRILQSDVDSILLDVNNSHSTYIPSSTISNFNKSEQDFCYLKADDIHFLPVYEKAKEVHKSTQGYFDPTIGPLINYWGFGFNATDSVTIDSNEVSSLLRTVDFESIRLNKSSDKICIQRMNKKSQLDFSAIAKGYGIDVISSFFDQNNISNYLIDIGGEARAKGINNKDSVWTLGVNKPSIHSKYSEILKLVELNNKAIATSGNYRNYHMAGGQMFAHIINPMEGYFEESNILSVTVIADDCMTADAYATAFMLMPLEKAINTAKSQNIEAFFIINSDTSNGYNFQHTKGMTKYLKN